MKKKTVKKMVNKFYKIKISSAVFVSRRIFYWILIHKLIITNLKPSSVQSDENTIFLKLLTN